MNWWIGTYFNLLFFQNRQASTCGWNFVLLTPHYLISNALNNQLASLFGITCTRTAALVIAFYQIKTNGPSGGKHTVAWVTILASVLRSVLLCCQIFFYARSVSEMFSLGSLAVYLKGSLEIFSRNQLVVIPNIRYAEELLFYNKHSRVVF